MTIKGNRSSLPYDTRNNSNVGHYQGMGIRGQTGQKKGTFTDIPLKDNKMPNAKPPRKFN